VFATGESSRGDGDAAAPARAPGDGRASVEVAAAAGASGGLDGTYSRRSGPGGSGGERRQGTLIAIATAPRATEDKEAALALQEHHPNIVAKTVSLMEAPSPLELKNQLELLAEKFELMLGHTARPPRPQRSRSPSSSLAPAPAPAPSKTPSGSTLTSTTRTTEEVRWHKQQKQERGVKARQSQSTERVHGDVRPCAPRRRATIFG
ncbi:unnamed protein product, partial [Pylaiella littoralis]